MALHNIDLNEEPKTIEDLDNIGFVHEEGGNHFIEKFFTRYPGVKLPVGIDNFINLEKLAVVDADMEESGLLVEELGKLTQLRKLAICNLKKEDGMQLFASVQNMKYLRSLKP
ncbi:hypothetical protein FRX31_023711 [Thalictrum thalictroides]|uniref:Disease resistance protein n=1 Tax=Thalictrum thalictroides TaxID=46969 RepID=A0A7J6VPK8_THATH|nr:hypothetical protein FRX31_023711 [Thalictrum thalictroides]